MNSSSLDRPAYRAAVPFPQRESARESNRIAPRHLLTPQNLDAEQSTLGAMLMEASALSLARELVNAGDFYRVLHTKIFAAICAVEDSGVAPDIVSVAEELRSRDELEDCGGSEYLSALIEACPSSANVASYARIVFDLAGKRRLATLAHELELRSFNGKSSGEIRGWLKGQLDEMAARVPDTGAREWSGAEIMTAEFPPARCAVENLIPIGLTIFAGAPKIGKSWMSYALALAVAKGGLALGKHEVEPGEALYLALEDQPRRLKERLGKLLTGPNGVEAAPEALKIYCDWPKLDAGGLEKLGAWLLAHPDCRLVVVDTFQKIRPGRDGSNFYEEDYAHFAALKRVADARDVAIVVVLHTSKRETSDALQSIAGSTGQVGAADAILVLSRSRGGKDGKLYCVGRDIDEREISLHWTPEYGAWTELDEEEAAASQMSAERREIIEILHEAQWPLAPREIAELIDKKDATVRKLLWSMKNAGEVRADPNGKYDLDPEMKNASRPVTVPMNGTPNGAPYSAPHGAQGVTVTGVTESNVRFRSKSRGNAVTPVTRVAPPLPDWLDEATTHYETTREKGAEFWQLWHDSYDAACDDSTFDHYFPLWLRGEFIPAT